MEPLSTVSKMDVDSFVSLECHLCKQSALSIQSVAFVAWKDGYSSFG